MSPGPGSARTPSNTARPAEKGPTERLSHAQMNQVVDALVSVSGCRRRQARERINAWLSDGRPLDDVEAYLRASYRIDPTGVEAVRNVDRKRAGGGRVAG